MRFRRATARGSHNLTVQKAVGFIAELGWATFASGSELNKPPAYGSTTQRYATTHESRTLQHLVAHKPLVMQMWPASLPNGNEAVECRNWNVAEGTLARILSNQTRIVVVTQLRTYRKKIEEVLAYDVAG